MQTPAFMFACAALVPSRFTGASICTRPIRSLNSLLTHSPQARQHTHHAPSRIVMFEENDNGEDDGVEVVELCDPDSDRSIRVGIEYEFEADDTMYYMCFPIDDPVTIAYEEDGELLEVDDERKMRGMFADAERALMDVNVVLKNTAYWLTVDDFRTMDEEEEEEEVAESEDGEVMADFEHGGRTYMVVRPMFPVYMIAKEGKHGISALCGEELARITPIAEQYYEENVEIEQDES